MSNSVLPSSAEVARFLHNDGWTKIGNPNPRLLVFRSPDTTKDDFGKSIILTIPSRPGFVDESQHVSVVLELLSEIKQTTMERMIFLIKNQSSDIFDQRIFGVEDIQGISMGIIPNIMKCLKDLIYYSACATEDASPFIIGSRKIGKEYSDKCRFIQTFPGSFGMRLEMPLPLNFNSPLPIETTDDSNDKNEFIEPFERKVMKRIYNGLNLAVKGLNEGDISIITNNYKSGFNANLCDAMANLIELLPDYTFGYNFAWSNEYSIDSQYVQPEEIRIPSKQYNELFASAAKSLRSSYESRNITVSGEIIGLHSEMVDDELIQSNNQFITIAWKQRHKTMKVRVPLNKDDYRKACDAHRDGKMVCIKGILQKSGKQFILYNSSDFSIIS